MKKTQPLKGAVAGATVGLARTMLSNEGTVKLTKSFAKEAGMTAAIYAVIGAIAAASQKEGGGYEEAATKGAIVGLAVQSGTAVVLGALEELKFKRAPNMASAKKIAKDAAWKALNGAVDGTVIGTLSAAMSKEKN